MMAVRDFLSVLNILSLSTGVARNRSEREVRGAGLVLQTVWGYKELRRTLEKDGWKKTDFMVNLNLPSNPRTNGGYEDSTLPLIDKGEVMKGKHVKCCMLQGHTSSSRSLTPIKVCSIRKNQPFFQSLFLVDWSKVVWRHKWSELMN